ncbi:restriction endonuclease subunit R [Siminovitchia terrae]|uniref:Restriction endonuclease subunit R n=1 Tax=Siminovitchia terrae TaxID=1914933 RepID=A0A429X9U0_SIMTE|nr:DEAD/DEAH box helicase family protein [Siminovitchia terrae]RST60129.1 restriction endonuclease subunit R [Siminovitchia terrae]
MIQLADFQLQTIGKLIESMEDDKREVILKSPTGSGKTIILTHFIDEYGKGQFDNVFVWLTPGKGDLEEQSKEKMDRYIHNSQTKLLPDVMAEGFKENDACFINWEKLTKKGNNALKESEKTNFQEHITQAHNNGLSFIIIVDESHQNDTVKADDIIQLFKPKKIIRTSATPKKLVNATLIEVDEVDVIAEGLIKKMLIINEDFGRSITVDNQVGYLLDKALEKQAELKKVYKEHDSITNPLIIIQLPNNSDVLQNEVELYLASKDVTYENGLLAVWLNNKKQNLEEIENLDAKPIAVIIKQAVATGWDCPRAQILVKLRENTSETFEIQTIGRIRRMPEAKHYENDLLDSCYLYTFDEKFTEGVKLHLRKGALDAVKLFLKQKHRNVTLISEQKSSLSISKDAIQALKSLLGFYQMEYGVTTKTGENKTRLEAKGYIFSEEIVKKIYTGEVRTLTSDEFKNLQSVQLVEPLNTHKHGREYHNRISALGLSLNLQYEQMNTIIRRLFDKNVRYDQKILRLQTREVYAFVINNFYKLKEDIQSAMSSMDIQETLSLNGIIETPFHLPKEYLFTYDGENRVQREYDRNVYSGYLSSAEVRSDSEKSFEKYCEEAESIEWLYKNGDKGSEYFSIVYQDNFGKQKSFYPDYVLSKDGEIWIIETKGGFSRTGESEDIDKFSPKKFEVLKRYLNKHNLKGGFVRKDKSNNELFICMDEYNDDIKGSSWILLSEVLS